MFIIVFANDIDYCVFGIFSQINFLQFLKTKQLLCWALFQFNLWVEDIPTSLAMFVVSLPSVHV